MSDKIGELGLGTAELEAAVDRSVAKMKDLGMEALAVTKSLAGVALVAAGVLAKGIYESRQRAKELAETLKELQNSDPFGAQLASIGSFESKLKDINKQIKEMDDSGIGDRIFDFIGSARLLGGEGFDATLEEQERIRVQLAKEYEDTLQRIAARQREHTDVLRLQLEGDEEGAKILKIQLDYREKIAKAIENGNGPLAAALKTEEKITLELEKQNQLKKTWGDAEEGIAKDREAHDKKNRELMDKAEEGTVKDREAHDKKNRSLMDKAEDGTEKDRKKHDEKNKELMDRAEEGTLNDRLEHDKRERKRIAENKAYTDELKGDSMVTDLARKGNKTMAEKERIAQDFDRKIKDAIRDKNPEAEAELRKQANAAQAGYDVTDAKKTSAMRREERASGRELERDEANAARQKADLDSRLDKGARGDKESRLEQRRAEREREKGRATGQDAAKKGEVPPEQQGYGQSDRKLLEEINNSLKVKD